MLGRGGPSVLSLPQRPPWQRSTSYFQSVVARIGGALLFLLDVVNGRKSLRPGPLRCTHQRRAGTGSSTNPREADGPAAVPPPSPSPMRLFSPQRLAGLSYGSRGASWVGGLGTSSPNFELPRPLCWPVYAKRVCQCLRCIDRDFERTCDPWLLSTPTPTLLPALSSSIQSV